MSDDPPSSRVVASVARIEGRVQGVGFRYWVENRAQELGLRGYVRNMTDGSVEALFVGAGQDVARMLVLCEDGPTGAAVDRVDSATPASVGGYASFRRASTAAPGDPPPTDVQER